MKKETILLKNYYKFKPKIVKPKKGKRAVLNDKKSTQKLDK